MSKPSVVLPIVLATCFGACLSLSPVVLAKGGGGSPRPHTTPKPTAASPARPAPSPQAQWPTIGQLLGESQPGQWVKYQQSQSMRGNTQDATVWQVVEARDGVSVQYRLIMAGAGDQAVEPPAEGKTQSQTLKLADAYPAAPVPPAATVTQDITTASPYAHLKVGEAVYAGTKLTRVMKLALPGNMTMEYQIELWLSPDVPVTGIAKQRLTISGAMTGSMTLDVVTSSKLVEDAKALAKTYELPNIGQPSDILEYSEKIAFASWKLDEKGQSDQKQMFSPVEAYHALFARAAVEMGFKPWALKARQRVPNFQNRRDIHDAFETWMSLYGTRKDLLEYGVSENRVDQVMVTAIAKARSPDAQYDWDSYLEFVRSQNAPDLRRIAIGEAQKNKDLNVQQQQQLLQLYMDPQDKVWWRTRVFNLHGKTQPDPEAVDRILQIDPTAGEGPAYPVSKANALIRTGQPDAARPVIEEAITRTNAVIKANEADPAKAVNDVRALVDLLKLARDKRYAAYDRLLMGMQNASVVKLIVQQPARANEKYIVPHLAKWQAATGNRTEAMALIAKMEMVAPVDVIPLVVTFYAQADKPGEALQWWEDLTKDAGQGPANAYRTSDLQAEAALGFAEHHLSIGDEKGYRQWLETAANKALDANKEINAFHKEHDDRSARRYWRMGESLLDDPPYISVIDHLLKHPSPQNDQLMLRVLGALEDESPHTAGPQNAWEKAAIDVAKAGRRDLYKQIAAALPRDWQNNWYTAVVSRATPDIAVIQDDDQGNVAYVRELVALQEKPDWKAELLRSAIVELANKGRMKDAQALMEDMKRAVKDGAWAKHQSFAAVALARGYAAAYDVDKALAAFNDRNMNLDEQIPIRGVNGRNWVNYLYDLGIELGNAYSSPDINDYSQYDGIATWAKAVEDKRELAAITLGMARAYYMKQNAR